LFFQIVLPIGNNSNYPFWFIPQAFTIIYKRRSQKCAVLGHVEDINRKSQEKFECASYGHRANADLNAVKKILAAGLAVTACGAATLGTLTKLESRKRNTA